MSIASLNLSSLQYIIWIAKRIHDQNLQIDVESVTDVDMAILFLLVSVYISLILPFDRHTFNIVKWAHSLALLRVYMDVPVPSSVLLLKPTDEF